MLIFCTYPAHDPCSCISCSSNSDSLRVALLYPGGCGEGLVGWKGTGGESLCRFFSFSWMKQSGGCQREAWRQLFWSLAAMETGLHPLADVDGTPTNDGFGGRPIAKDAHADKHFCAILLWCKGDLEYMSNDVGIPHWSSNLCCGLCGADKAGNNFKDNRRAARWRREGGILFGGCRKPTSRLSIWICASLSPPPLFQWGPGWSSITSPARRRGTGTPHRGFDPGPRRHR